MQYPSQRQAMERLQSAFNRWDATWNSFADHSQRLRNLARAAEEQQKACLVAELADLRWKPGESDQVSIPAELKPGRRPGPPRLWRDFDRAVEALGQGIVGDGFTNMGQAFGQMKTVCNDLADALDASEVAAPRGAGKERKAS